MKTKHWRTQMAGSALFLSLLACGRTEKTDQEPNNLYEEVSYERAEPPAEPFTQEGEASYYHPSLAGEPMANGKPYKPNQLTAAHKRLPLGTKVEVVNQDNDSTVVVEITDRGPYVGERILDVSRAAARELDFVQEGKTEVELEVVESADGHTVADSVPQKAASGDKDSNKQ